MFSLRLTNALSLSAGFLLTCGGTCFFIDGSIDQSSSPCYVLTSVGASVCYRDGETCQEGSLCAGDSGDLVGPNDENNAIWRRMCSDYTWQDPACFASAPCKFLVNVRDSIASELIVDLLMLKRHQDVLAYSVRITRCGDGTYCPRNDHDLNMTCYGNRLGVMLGLSNAPIAPSSM